MCMLIYVRTAYRPYLESIKLALYNLSTAGLHAFIAVRASCSTDNNFTFFIA